MMKRLSAEEIEKFASRPGARRIAVENFLGSVPLEIGFDQNFLNLMKDAELYNWNASTVHAIRNGLKLMFRGGLK
jgi:hypothetical protein